MNHPEYPVTRRQLIRSAGLMAGAFALAACDTSPPEAGGDPTGPPAGATGGGGTGGSGPLHWWDQFNPMQDLHRATFERFTAEGGPEVEHTVTNPNEQGQALQLAFGSQQLPDVFTLAGVGVAPSVLYAQGWFSPLSNADAIRAALPALREAGFRLHRTGEVRSWMHYIAASKSAHR
jgi:multiple sugar transport system substrate-binding protein